MRLKHWFYIVPLRLRSLFRRRRVEQELDDELRYHLERQIEEYLAKGMTPEDARSAALRALGGVEQRKEECRDLRRVKLIEDLVQDLRYGLRVLRKNPGYTAVAALTLGLGIGANTAIFSVIDALMLRPLPVRHPEQLLAFSQSRDGRIESGQWGWWPYTWFERFRELAPFFEGMTITGQVERYNLSVNGLGNNLDPGPVRVGLVSGNYLSTLGVGAVMGRALSPDDDRTPGQQPVAIISHDYWKRGFGRAPDVVGRTFRLEQTSYTVVGVTAAEFTGDLVGQPADIWIPAMMQSQVMPERPGLLTNQTGQSFGRILARLRPRVLGEQARAAGQVVFDQVLNELTKQSGRQIARRRIELIPAARGDSEQRETFARPLVILLIACGLTI